MKVLRKVFTDSLNMHKCEQEKAECLDQSIWEARFRQREAVGFSPNISSSFSLQVWEQCWEYRKPPMVRTCSQKGCSVAEIICFLAGKKLPLGSASQPAPVSRVLFYILVSKIRHVIFLSLYKICLSCGGSPVGASTHYWQYTSHASKSSLAVAFKRYSSLM